MLYRHDRQKLPGWRAMTAVALGAMLGGCMHALERHHFKVIDDKGEGNYFRVDVSARACVSSSRYLSGYFDEGAVDAYFGTYKQPTDASFPASVTPSPPSSAEPGEGDKASTSGKAEPLDPCLKGKKLVMLLSSNSDEIASQISAFADGKEASNLLARLVTAREGEEARVARNTLDILRREAELVAAAGDSLLIEPDSEADMIAFANRVARAMGSTKVFADLNAAREWLAEQQRELGGR